ncbi:MAG: hypothetical protein O2816_10440 [Planctomycetota bacterium]|nr:hypothetical protein [Planctomycetota bacterium]
MSEQPAPEPFHESNLDDPEYRDRLMRKLNCLIAVLEVANAKVKRSLNGPAPDVDRLKKIKTNLTSTLEVCRRAKRALERRESLPEGLPENLAQVVRRSAASHLPEHANVEMSSPEEHKRFVEMGAITRDEMKGVDFDDLARKLQED